MGGVGSLRGSVAGPVDEAEVERRQKQGEVNETSQAQKLRRQGQPKEWNGNVIPRQVPARPGGDKEGAGQELEDIPPMGFHQVVTGSSLARGGVAAERVISVFGEFNGAERHRLVKASQRAALARVLMR